MGASLGDRAYIKPAAFTRIFLKCIIFYTGTHVFLLSVLFYEVKEFIFKKGFGIEVSLNLISPDFFEEVSLLFCFYAFKYGLLFKIAA